MKLLAVILNLYFVALLVQPALLPVPSATVSNCCTSEGKEVPCKQDQTSGQNDLCNSGRCNPLFSQCPLFHCTLPGQSAFYSLGSFAALGPIYAIFSYDVIKGHSRDIIHPPEDR